MKKLLATGALAGAQLLGGCSLFTQIDGTNVPYNLTTADKEHFDTIGVEFREYYTADETLTDEQETLYNATLDSWLANGSTTQTFETIVGDEYDGPYPTYIESDKNLTDADKTARKLNVTAWEINIESREAATTEGVE